METLVWNVRDLAQTDRAALERVVGHELAETQQVILNVVDLGDSAAKAKSGGEKADATVPDWWKIYEGLSEVEVDELDRAIRQRADLTRDIG